MKNLFILILSVLSMKVLCAASVGPEGTNGWKYSTFDNFVETLAIVSPGTRNPATADIMGRDPVTQYVGKLGTFNHLVTTDATIIGMQSSISGKADASALNGKADKTTTLTINGTAFDLSTNRTWTLTSSNISEGSNLYYTSARFNSAFAGKTTADLSEGTNLYYTDLRFDNRFNTKTTTNLNEGTNLYYTAARFNTAFSGKTTSDLIEGVNLYFTLTRARSAFTASNGIAYNNSTGNFTNTSPDPGRTVNAAIVGLTRAQLNTAYPDVPVGYNVMCPDITLGGAIYVKTTENGTNDRWQTISAPPTL